MTEVTIDFVTADPWQMVLVEEGPWEDVAANLRRLQDRLYGCVDAALDGSLAERFPESTGAKVVIRLDGYNLPMPDSWDFFQRFSAEVLEIEDYKRALQNSPHVCGIEFVANFQ